jgi:hypothetical protein
VREQVHGPEDPNGRLASGGSGDGRDPQLGTHTGELSPGVRHTTDGGTYGASRPAVSAALSVAAAVLRVFGTLLLAAI